ncbi:MAG: LuxR C-terminal-related transcriptional regulator [Bacteroidetes bacterium]|nr:LuxR C-terminal-related transcriptional regulator [Bacteroidota bacterium]
MRKILLIESNKQLLDKTIKFLTDNNYNVIVTTEGTAGIQKALEFLPDLILCDSEVPGLNGYEIFNTLLQINSTAIIPFVFLLNQATNEDVRAAMNLGADDYLEIPFNNNDLLKLIEIRLEKQEKIMSLADEKFNTLMEHSSDGVFIYQDEKLSYVNKKFCDLMSYSKRELIGMNLVNIIYKDDIHLVIDKISRLQKGIHKDFQSNFRAITGDQKISNFILSGNSINVNGKKSIVGTIKLQEENTNQGFVPKECDIKITERESEVLELICLGYSNSEIAKELNISDRTVEGHRANLLNKTGSRNTASLAIFAVKYGFFQIKDE